MPFIILNKTIFNTRKQWNKITPLLKKYLIVPPNCVGN